ncbi:MAG: hypothetical protein Tsb002_31300 [Wenzhouxiangellaceae bacterium]
MARRRSKTKQADQADRHILYQQAVQDTEAELDFVEETYREIRGHALRLLREDFCGTANTACDFVRRKRSHSAIAVDNDAAVLDWGRQHNVAALSDKQQQRIELVEGDVREVSATPVQAVLAMNFSYYLFRTRDELREYFQSVRRSLADDGVFFMDAYGGYEAHMELTESRDCDGFTYIWDQAEFNPINHHMTCHIHFKFDDGSKMKRAFSYHWRLWSLPELQEILTEAGFKQVQVYWEGTDEETGEGDGVYEPAEQGDADPGWVTYIAAWD